MCTLIGSNLTFEEPIRGEHQQTWSSRVAYISSYQWLNVRRLCFAFTFVRFLFSFLFLICQGYTNTNSLRETNCEQCSLLTIGRQCSLCSNALVLWCISRQWPSTVIANLIPPIGRKLLSFVMSFALSVTVWISLSLSDWLCQLTHWVTLRLHPVIVPIHSACALQQSVGIIGQLERK